MRPYDGSVLSVDNAGGWKKHVDSKGFDCYVKGLSITPANKKGVSQGG